MYPITKTLRDSFAIFVMLRVTDKYMYLLIEIICKRSFRCFRLIDQAEAIPQHADKFVRNIADETSFPLRVVSVPKIPP